MPVAHLALLELRVSSHPPVNGTPGSCRRGGTRRSIPAAPRTQIQLFRRGAGSGLLGPYGGSNRTASNRPRHGDSVAPPTGIVVSYVAALTEPIFEQCQMQA